MINIILTYDLGIGNTSNTPTPPTLVSSLQNQKIVQVSCGSKHTAFLTSTGAIYVCGLSDFGQLGLGPIRVSADEPVLIEELKDKVVTQIACGHYHSICITSNKEAYAFGRGSSLGLHSDLFLPTIIPELSEQGVCMVAAGANFSAALTETGTNLSERLRLY
jgi:alpha-tubulin suppressor-like RCC1 family protein